MFSDHFNHHMNWACYFISKYTFFIDQQEDSLLSSGDESSIFILGSKNSVSFYVSFYIIHFLRPRHTMRQITATRCLVCTAAATSCLLLVCRCDMSHKFKPVWIHATDRTDKILLQRRWFSHVTRADLLQQPVMAMCRSDLSHCVSGPLRLSKAGCMFQPKKPQCGYICVGFG